MSVYFIANPEARAIKIGVATEPRNRFRQLQTASPRPLVMLGWLPGSYPEEAIWHQRWEACRQSGEWFEATDRLVSAIAHALQGRLSSRSAPPPEGIKPDQWAEFHRLAGIDPEIKTLIAEAYRHRVTSVADPDFCANAAWYGYDGFPGIKPRLVQIVGWGRPDRHPELGTMEAYSLVYEVAYAALPDCRGNCTCTSVLEALLG